MGFFSDFSAINKVVFKRVNEAFKKNLLLIPMLGLYLTFYIIISILLNISVGRLGLAGNFLVSIMTWFFSCYVISDYLSHLESAINGFKFRLDQIGKNYMRYFIPLLAATAIPRIVTYLFFRLTGISIGSFWIIIFYLAYATIEVVYQKDLDRLEIFVYGHKFLLENWQHWLLINMIHGFAIVAIGLVVDMFVVVPLSGYPLAVFLSVMDAFPYIPVIGALGGLPAFVSIPIIALVGTILVAIPIVYYMIYRGFIFKILSVSSRRKREYMRNIYGK